jgi:1,4-alpha-glucan branching enzyme
MHFVLTLHSHLPWVLNHGRWPLGSEWLLEAALDTYLPLLETLEILQKRGVPAPVTLGLTPVLANQLTSPRFKAEMDAFLLQRLEACEEAPLSLRRSGDRHLLPLVGFWRDRFLRLQRVFQRLNGDLVGTFRRMEDAGSIEIITSAATHGFLPLLGREESIRLQLLAGLREHRRLFGRDPQGCWIPECAYRPAGEWDPIPGVSRKRDRPGLETFLEEAGFRYFFIDTHMAEAGLSLGAYGDVPHGAERFDAVWEGTPEGGSRPVIRSPYQSFRSTGGAEHQGVAVFAREPRSSTQVWSRHYGYPGGGSYLEFHKIRWPGGLKYWRVTGPETDLGDKEPYDPAQAKLLVHDHADHFASLLGRIQEEEGVGPQGVCMAPFDTELFGHWWFEGVDFLAEVYETLPSTKGVVTVTASQHLDSFPPQEKICPLEGSWGAKGDFTMWLNPQTEWTWTRLWPLEETFWNRASGAWAHKGKRKILATAARQLLLAQSSDWQFMISTGAVPDYAEKRFNLHCDSLERLLPALAREASEDLIDRERKEAERLEERDPVFPDVLETLGAVLDRV